MLNKLINHISLLLFTVVCFSISAKNSQALFDKQSVELQSSPLLSNLNHQELIKHIEILASDRFAGRKFATPASTLAQNYIIAQLKNAQVKPFLNKYRHSFMHKTILSTKQGSNIIAVIKGKTYPKRYIILTAHYDHLGQKQRRIYNGADDNASGVAALLTFATQLAKTPLKHSVIFLFTDAEEVNLLGSKAFVKQQETLLSTFKLNINIDMVAGNKYTHRLHFINKGLDKLLTNVQLEVLKTTQTPVKLKKGFRSNLSRGANRRKWYEASDHSVFYHAGIPFIYFGVETHKNYHTPQDTFSNINLEFFISACQTIYQQLRFIDKHMSDKNLTN